MVKQKIGIKISHFLKEVCWHNPFTPSFTNGPWVLCHPLGSAVGLLPSLEAAPMAITDLWLSGTTNGLIMSHILLQRACALLYILPLLWIQYLNNTHHLPSEDFDPLICLHTWLGAEVEYPLRKHQAEDTNGNKWWMMEWHYFCILSSLNIVRLEDVLVFWLLSPPELILGRDQSDVVFL